MLREMKIFEKSFPLTFFTFSDIEVPRNYKEGFVVG